MANPLGFFQGKGGLVPGQVAGKPKTIDPAGTVAPPQQGFVEPIPLEDTSSSIPDTPAIDFLPSRVQTDLGDIFRGLTGGLAGFDTGVATADVPVPTLASFDKFVASIPEDLRAQLDIGAVRELISTANRPLPPPEDIFGGIGELFFGNQRDQEIAAAGDAFDTLRQNVANLQGQSFLSNLGANFVDQINALFDDPESTFGNLTSDLEARLADPLFSDEDILAEVGRITGERSDQGQQIVQGIDTNLAGRGIFRSGVGADLVSSANNATASDITNISSEVRTNLKNANEAAVNQISDILGRLTSLETGAKNQAQTTQLGLEAGNLPFVDPSALFNSLTEVGNQFANIGLGNTQIRQNTDAQNKELAQGDTGLALDFTASPLGKVLGNQFQGLI